MRLFCFAVVLSLVSLSPRNSWADVKKESIDQAQAGSGITIYMDVSALGRTTRAAKRMTELHQAYFAKGWTVVDVDPYIENGDLQGFFITYVGRQ